MVQSTKAFLSLSIYIYTETVVMSSATVPNTSGIKLLMVFGWYPNWCPMGFVLIGIDAKSCEKLRLVRDLPIA